MEIPSILRPYISIYMPGGDPVNMIDPAGREEEEEGGLLSRLTVTTTRVLTSLTEGAVQAAQVVGRVAGLAYITLNDFLSAAAASEYTGAVVKTFFCISLGVMVARMLDEVDLSNDAREAALIDYKLVCSLVIIAPWNLDNTGLGGGDDF